MVHDLFSDVSISVSIASNRRITSEYQSGNYLEGRGLGQLTWDE